VPQELTSAEPSGEPAGGAQPDLQYSASPETPPSPGWRWPLLWALLVLVAGVVLGTVVFAAEQYYFVWEPDVTSLPGDGRRVAGSAGQRPTAPVLVGDRLAWSQGGYTCLMELPSGDTKVIGAASGGTDLWPPALDAHSVTWLESDKNGVDPADLWVYDIGRGRRVVYQIGVGAAGPVVAGDLIAWPDVSGSGVQMIAALDLATERRSVIATGDEISAPVIAGEDSVGWLVQPGAGRAPSFVVRDLRTMTDTTVPLAANGSGLTVTDIHMGGRTLLWALQSSTGTRVMAFDLDTHATNVVAQGAVVQSPATDGTVVIWAARDGSSDACVVMMRSLKGGQASIAARPQIWPSSLAVSGGRLAWVINDGTWTYLDVVKLPS
jgi:hypothetical protein